MARPTKYNKEMLPIMLEKFKEGASICEVCVELDITRETFYQWQKENKEFSDTIKKGLALSQAWWEKIGKAGTVNKLNVNPTMWIFNMKNRFREEWHDGFKHEHTGDVNIIVSKEGFGKL